jgi:hypothetical protein
LGKKFACRVKLYLGAAENHLDHVDVDGTLLDNNPSGQRLECTGTTNNAAENNRYLYI